LGGDYYCPLSCGDPGYKLGRVENTVPVGLWATVEAKGGSLGFRQDAEVMGPKSEAIEGRVGGLG